MKGPHARGVGWDRGEEGEACASVAIDGRRALLLSVSCSTQSFFRVGGVFGKETRCCRTGRRRLLGPLNRPMLYFDRNIELNKQAVTDTN